MRLRKLMAAVAATALVALPAFAATFQSGETLSVRLPVADDLYAGAGALTLNDDVAGDAMLAGGQVLVTGIVNEDLTAVGGSLNLQGPVADDLRAAGGSLTITSSVADDALLFGGSVTVGGNVTIGGDAVIAGGGVILDGTIGGNVLIYGGEVILDAVVSGGAKIEADLITINGTIAGPSELIAREIRLGDDARFGAPVRYWSEKGRVDFGDRVTGEATFDPLLQRMIPAPKADYEAAFGRMLMGLFVFSLLSATLVMAVLIGFGRRTIGKAVAHARERFWASFGLGVLFLFVTPLAALLLLITAIGWPFAILLMACYILMLIFAMPLAAVMVALWLRQQYEQEWKPFTVFLVSILAYIVLKLMVWVPIIGWIAGFVVVASAIGSAMRVRYDVYREIEKSGK